MTAKVLGIVGGLAALVIGTQVQAAVVFTDNFSGAGGTPVNPATWTADNTGTNTTTNYTGSNSLLLYTPDGGDSANVRSVQTFAPSASQVLKATMTVKVTGGGTIIGLDSASPYTGGIFIYETGDILVRHAGGNTTSIGSVGGSIQDSTTHTLEIDWSSTKVKVLWDGVEKGSTTAPANIPDITKPLFLEAIRYTASSGKNMWLSNVSVDISPVPEPSTMGILGVCSVLALRRRRSSRAAR